MTPTRRYKPEHLTSGLGQAHLKIVFFGPACAGCDRMIGYVHEHSNGAQRATTPLVDGGSATLTAFAPLSLVVNTTRSISS
jgi:hypothetical protein